MYGKGKIWFDGKMVPWKKANIHLLSHVVHYGSSVFEGVRCYLTKQGPAIFRATEHAQRLLGEIPFVEVVDPYAENGRLTCQAGDQERQRERRPVEGRLLCWHPKRGSSDRL